MISSEHKAMHRVISSIIFMSDYSANYQGLLVISKTTITSNPQNNAFRNQHLNRHQLLLSQLLVVSGNKHE